MFEDLGNIGNIKDLSVNQIIKYFGKLLTPDDLLHIGKTYEDRLVFSDFVNTMMSDIKNKRDEMFDFLVENEASVDKEALVRGALLHDFYMYDWHEKKLSELHGFRHPRAAIKEAIKDYKLTDKEKEMIKHHMFPFTYDMPKSKEAKILCIADKICAWGEMVDGIL